MTVRGPILPWDTAGFDLKDLLWVSRFRDRESEIRKGATFNGDAIADRGLELDGTGDYLEYVLNGQLDYGLDPVGIHVACVPHFDWDESGVERSFFDCEPSIEFRFAKSAGDLLLFNVGGTNIFTTASATIAPLWKKNDYNALTVSATNGDTNAWVNGTQVETNDATAYGTIPALTELTVGARGAATGPFDGRILLLAFFNRAMTSEDHEALYNSRPMLVIP